MDRGDSGAPGQDDEFVWVEPSLRGDAVIATWFLLVIGHLLEVGFGVWALFGGGLSRASDSSAAVAAVVVIAVLGCCGSAVAIWILRSTLRVRMAVSQERAVPAVSPSPLTLSALFVALALGVGVIALLSWQAIGIMPAVACELVFLPLAVRTEHYLSDAAQQVP